MFKKNWIVYVVYRDWDEKLKAEEKVYKGVTKKEAKSKMYDHICWNKNGKMIGFRNVFVVSVQKFK